MKNYVDFNKRVIRTHCTRCGCNLIPGGRHRNNGHTANIRITEITIDQMMNGLFEFESTETLCMDCKKEFMQLFNVFMKKTAKDVARG